MGYSRSVFFHLSSVFSLVLLAGSSLERVGEGPAIVRVCSRQVAAAVFLGLYRLWQAERDDSQLWYPGSPNCVLVANARSQVSPDYRNQRDVAAIAGWLRLEVGKHFFGYRFSPGTLSAQAFAARTAVSPMTLAIAL